LPNIYKVVKCCGCCRF